MKVLLLSLGASNNIFINPFSYTVRNFCGLRKNIIIIGSVFTNENAQNFINKKTYLIPIFYLET